MATSCSCYHHMKNKSLVIKRTAALGEPLPDLFSLLTLETLFLLMLLCS